MPVALPPGRAKLTTRPRATGPLVTPNTIGMFVVVAFEPYHRRRRLLLRPRRQRPRNRRTAEERDELAPSDERCHLIPPAGRAREG